MHDAGDIERSIKMRLRSTDVVYECLVFCVEADATDEVEVTDRTLAHGSCLLPDRPPVTANARDEVMRSQIDPLQPARTL